MQKTTENSPPVAIVTGGARRIGRQLAIDLHAAGLDIALHYHSSRDEADSLAGQLCRQREGSCHTYRADLEDTSAVQDLGQRLLARHGRIDLLVNNASGFAASPIAECTPETFDQMLSSNLRGAYVLIQALLPGLRQAGGSVVNILDMHLTRPLRSFSAYLAAKAGLASVTQSLAVELAPDIRVNGIAPGAILWPEDGLAYDDQTRRATIARTPLGRLGTPGDISAAVLFLAQSAPFVTGQILTIDGGQSLT